MKTIKRRWTVANSRTGEITQIMKPVTRTKAMKIFSRMDRCSNDWILFEHFEDIKPGGMNQ